MDIITIKNQIKTKILVTKYLSQTLPNSNYYNCFKCHQKNKIIVNHSQNMYKCFKCDNRFHDIFDLYQELYQVNFNTAFQALINELDEIKLSPLIQNPHQFSHLNKTKFKILTTSANYYHYLLKNYVPFNELALNYLQNQRQLNLTTINEFKLGLAPQTNSNYQFINILVNYLTKNNFDLDLVQFLNLAISTKNPHLKNFGLKDAFYNAIIIPKTALINQKIQVISLKANLLKRQLNTPKYLEMKSNDLIKPRDYLYRLFEHLPFINAKKQVIIVESEFDVIKSYQHQLKNVISICGKDFTNMQLKQIFQYIPKNYEILIILDHDYGGKIQALKLYLKLIQANYLVVKVIILPQYKSLDEFLDHYNLIELQLILNDAKFCLTLDHAIKKTP
ncbi:DNA primase [Candidatus Phytoplasma mali]|uniref:DNA primase n=1 Tax=Phytoplasma mali (strain AT) TaxID=482235 RepID=B3QZJ5_PHYMT|nr:toprim domain-containing protein [Candidatus Phytoplasma mali]CAP18602.1 DNA primase [Candidatus Phytoplasma mali]